VGIVVIFVLGLSGSLLPPQIKKWYPNYDMLSKGYFRLLTGFAAGVVLAVAFVHSIPDSFSNWESYTGEDPPTGTLAYPWPGFLSMMGVVITYMLEELFTMFLGVSHSHLHQHGQASYGTLKSDDIDVDTEQISSKQDDAKLLAEMWILWAGLSFHSIFVGLALGLEGNEFALFSAIVAHQFFEGLALGSRVAKLNLKRHTQIVLIDTAYALSAPIGIAIGLLVRSVVFSGSASSVCSYWSANMVIQALSGGILIYISLVHMIKEEIDCLHEKSLHKLLLFSGILLGAAAMAILAIWA